MYDAIVLAGGAARRLGGVDKATVDVGGRSLLDRVLAAVAECERAVVVGPPRTLPAGVRRTSERPAGGGPVAGLAAGLELVEAPLVAVLACDLPFLTSATLATLVNTLVACDAATDGAWLVDETGRQQPLTAVYRTASLRRVVSSLDTVAGTPMRAVCEALRMLDVRAPAGQSEDCDTWDDVRRARIRADQGSSEEP